MGKRDLRNFEILRILLTALTMARGRRWALDFGPRFVHTETFSSKKIWNSVYLDGVSKQ